MLYGVVFSGEVPSQNIQPEVSMFCLELQFGFLLQVLHLNISKHTIDVMSRMIRMRLHKSQLPDWRHCY